MVRRPSWIRGATRVGVIVAAVVGTAIPAAPAYAQDILPLASPSDDRAVFHTGNAVTCAQVGFPASIQIGAPDSSSAADINVAGTVAPRTTLNVAITPTGTTAGVVIDAVVVKGGDGFNLYQNPQFLPPTLPPPQNYISPRNAGGNIPEISHWFVCYHLITPLAGALVVDKQVIAPAGAPAQPLPSTFTVLVTCDNGFTTTITFGNGGGEANGSVIPGLPPGTRCAVVEQGTGDLPAGTVVSVDPAEAGQAPGVEIVADTDVEVTVINDFSQVAAQTGTVRIVKRVNGAPSPSSFTAEIQCEDGTNRTVTLPGSGGPAAPVTVTAGFLCALAEVPVPAGWGVTYSVNGGTATSTRPLFPVDAGQTVTVTVTNTAQLPVTGGATGVLAALGVSLLAAGSVLLLLTRRRIRRVP